MGSQPQPQWIDNYVVWPELYNFTTTNMVASADYDLPLNNQFKNCVIGYSIFQKASNGQ